MKSESERKDNAKIFNLVKNYNGWTRLEQQRTLVAMPAAPAAPGAPPAPDVRHTEKKIQPRLVFQVSIRSAYNA
jgi:hypothetical protein